MSADPEGWIFIGLVIALIIISVLCVWMLWQYAYGVTNDPAANCLMHEFPYIQLCHNEKLDEFMKKYYAWSLNRTK